MDWEALAKNLSEEKQGTYAEWVESLEYVRSQAGRAHLSFEKLKKILNQCGQPSDLATTFRTVLNLHREDHSLSDGWAQLECLVKDSDTSLPGWCRAMEEMYAYLESKDKRARTYDALQYVACTEESPEIKTGKAPLSTAVRHYLGEFGIDASENTNEST
ncbi:MAG: hypothetical protein AAF212_04545 [Verrucomicrobiota bacterium]